ncbi:hypothetical protein RJ639_028196 [Escallonia herrerae]|uniref:EF-hand domain-containing protein n=2 Tax=Escallonia TaxID=23075 RepID=A0AA88X5H5_9ASTE|nr:hypothetical protein RJ639_028196 [Escallonia herrerae]
MASTKQSQFQDFLPIMADKLGGNGLIGELCNGFRLLMDVDKGVITFDSLKRNSALLGLQDLTDDDLLSMLKEGDFDGDGALNQMEFCVLMFRLSPDLMEQSQFLLEEALQQQLEVPKGVSVLNKVLKIVAKLDKLMEYLVNYFLVFKIELQRAKEVPRDSPDFCNRFLKNVLKLEVSVKTIPASNMQFVTAKDRIGPNVRPLMK